VTQWLCRTQVQLLQQTPSAWDQYLPAGDMGRGVQTIARTMGQLAGNAMCRYAPIGFSDNRDYRSVVLCA
jgi:hypothetical protein